MTNAKKVDFLKNGIAQLAILVPHLEEAVENYWKQFGIGNWHIYTYAKPLVKKMTYHGRLKKADNLQPSNEPPARI